MAEAMKPDADGGTELSLWLMTQVKNWNPIQ
jgi:hypothetical protein